MAEVNQSIKSIIVALLANLGIGVVKTIAAVITKSGSMLAEAIHSYADCSNQLLLILGVKRSQRVADEKHPLGYGKAIYFWSFIVALMLFSMGGLFSIYEGLHKMQSKEPLSYPWIAVIVLSLGIILETVALVTALKAVKTDRGKLSLWKWFRTSRKSEMVVIVGEDLAAISGLVLALLAVAVSMITQNPIYDALGSMAIGVVLILVAILISVEVKSMLIGESAGEDFDRDVKSKIETHKKVLKILNYKSLQLGNDVMLAVKVKMKEKKDAQKLLSDVNAVEKELRLQFPTIRWIFFEPDSRD